MRGPSPGDRADDGSMAALHVGDLALGMIGPEADGMVHQKRGKISTVAPSDLSRLVCDYYQELFKREGQGEEFDRSVTAVWQDLLEAERCGADPGYLLHVLVCTKFQRRKWNIERSKTLQELTQRRRAALVGGLRAIRQLEWEGFKEIFGPAGEKWAQEVYAGIEYLYQQLTGGTIETPSFQMGSRARLSRRQAERLLTACIVCLMEELKGRHPKPAVAATVLLEKVGLLDRSQSVTAAIEFVKKRAQRAAEEVSDWLGPIGNPVGQLRLSYSNLKGFLMPPAIIPDRSPIWEEEGKAWGVKGRTFRQAFRRFCKFQGLRPTAEALGIFEGRLAQTREMGGPKALSRVFRKSQAKRRKIRASPR